jgi:hypothetical protein
MTRHQAAGRKISAAGGLNRRRRCGVPGKTKMHENSIDKSFWESEPHFAPEEHRLDHSYLLDLISVLKPHRGGLRRWSVMRAIRKHREAARLPIPHKLEDGVERVFRHYCADCEAFKKRGGALKTALFHLPQDKAGEVWAVHSDRAEAWLKAENGTPF